MERDTFHVPYLSDKTPEPVFRGQAVKTVAYLRVSTAQQDVCSQRLAILEYARKHDFRIDDFIKATASRQASEKRCRLDELMNGLQRGDRLVVSELSRLRRSLGQIVAILDALTKAGVAFVAMKENIRVEGKHDIQTKVMTTLFALFAEVERDLIPERTREGLAQARASGRKLARPKGSLGVSRLSGKEDDIRRFLELGVSKTAMAKLTGVSRTTRYRFMSTRGLKPSPAKAPFRRRDRHQVAREAGRLQLALTQPSGLPVPQMFLLLFFFPLLLSSFFLVPPHGLEESLE